MKILFQDKDIIVCIKPAGLLSTDEAGGMPDLIREALGKDCQVRTVHRLDSIVSGLMVYALSSEAASDLTRQIDEGTFSKTYYAVLEGRPAKEAGKLTDYLRRNARERKTYAVSGPGKGAEDAALLYKTIKKTRDLTLVRVELITGRTHQIRAQFSSRGLPLYGDRKYGAANTDTRIALFSCSLSFRHPVTGKAMKFKALPPSIMPWKLFPACHESYDEADIVREFQRSKRLSDCPYAESCEICAYQGLDYERQLEKKQKLASKWLKEFGQVSPILQAPASTHYKNRIVRTFAVSHKGKIISGINSGPKHKFLPVNTCLIENESVDPVVKSLRELIASYGLQLYDPASKTGWLKHVILRVSGANGDMMLALVASSGNLRDAFGNSNIAEAANISRQTTTSDHPVISGQTTASDHPVISGQTTASDHPVISGQADTSCQLLASGPSTDGRHMKVSGSFNRFLQELLSRHPQIKTVLLNVQNTFSPALLGKEDHILYGDGIIKDTLCGKTYELTLHSHFPENPSQTEKLYETALSYVALTGTDRVLHICSGSGMLGIRAADAAGKVICADDREENIREGMRFARANDFPKTDNLRETSNSCIKNNIRFKQTDPREYIDALARSHEKIQVVFLDGCHGRIDSGMTRSLVQLAPERIIFVFDDPAKLADQLKELATSSYRISKIQPVDLAPYTKKVGIVIFAERA